MKQVSSYLRELGIKKGCKTCDSHNPHVVRKAETHIASVLACGIGLLMSIALAWYGYIVIYHHFHTGIVR